MSPGTPPERIRDSPAPDSTVLRSRDLAELAGTTPRALRHYHRIGLLPEVPRDPNGYRRYSIRDLVTLLRIRQLAGGGMPLRRIRRVLEMDRQSQDEPLAELDRELAEQEQRLATQRKLLADLRRHGARSAAGTIAGRTTATQQFDEDVWTLVTTSTDLDQDAVTALAHALDEDALAEHAARWYREFEELETLTEIEEDRALQLADRIADFAEAMVRASGVTPTDEERPVMALVEQMEGVALSPAQQTVWSRFRTVIEQRWQRQAGSGDVPGGGTPTSG